MKKIQLKQTFSLAFKWVYFAIDCPKTNTKICTEIWEPRDCVFALWQKNPVGRLSPKLFSFFDFRFSFFFHFFCFSRGRFWLPLDSNSYYKRKAPFGIQKSPDFGNGLKIFTFSSHIKSSVYNAILALLILNALAVSLDFFHMLILVAVQCSDK